MKLLTIEEAASHLSIKKSRIRTAIFKKEIEFIKLGRLIRFTEDQLRNWVSKCTQGGAV